MSALASNFPFYVAGRTSDIRTVRQVMLMGKSLGWKLTFDWTKTAEEGGEGGIMADWTGHETRAREVAKREFAAVHAASLTIWLCNEGQQGSVFEAAWAARVGMLWIVKPLRDCVFFYLHDGIKRFNDLPDLYRAMEDFEVEYRERMTTPAPIILNP